MPAETDATEPSSIAATSDGSQDAELEAAIAAIRASKDLPRPPYPTLPIVGYATRPVDLPPETASIDEWRAFAARSAVRIDPHLDLRHAMAAVSGRMP